MKPNLPELEEAMAGIANRLIFLEKKTIHRHGGMRLHPTEIHLLMLIAGAPDLNAGEMAARLKVTTGAVSQTLTRLEKKGAIAKFRDPARKNELSARFTPEGKQALESFTKARREERMRFAGYLDGLTSKDQEVIACFLARWDEFLARLG
ncbi:MAG: MarR family transcriptional regulator [Thermodesulfobacteriota bacterium]